MIASPRSAAVKASVVRMLRADAQMFCCASGTIFGREVVPEVCSTRAMSSGAAAPGCARGPRFQRYRKRKRETARDLLGRGS
jgi:hypothetical protein